nr:hypothetical protein [Tanacetum cinerariifolium]
AHRQPQAPGDSTVAQRHCQRALRQARRGDRPCRHPGRTQPEPGQLRGRRRELGQTTQAGFAFWPADHAGP